MSAVTDRHRAFRALLAALSMPGTPHELPVDAGLPLILDAIYGERRADAIVAQSELRSEAIERADRGEEISPEGGATLYLLVDDETPWTQARIAGPGIRGHCETRVPLSRAALEARNRACAAFPQGIDIVALDRAVVTAFPRTTRIEALD